MGKAISSDLTEHPCLVATDFNLAVRTACEFWKMREISLKADADNFKGVMLLVNGGVHNGYQERFSALQRAKLTSIYPKIWGLPISRIQFAKSGVEPSN